MSHTPYLEGRPRDLFDAWHAAAVERFGRSLTFKEIRKGAQALSWLYVERRGRGEMSKKALDGQGKRAAFLLYFGALHYIVVHHAAQRVGLQGKSLRRIVDLGCGGGTSGAAWANVLPNDAAIRGIDRSGWSVDEAGRTYSAFGLRHETRRGDVLEETLPGEGEGILLGWTVSELEERSRSFLLRKIERAVQSGAALLVVEPVAGGVAPWWDEWAAALATHGVGAGEVRVSVQLPAWVRHMDRAAGLRHQTVTVRALHT